ncbi:hypothetical protein [Scleromatobacter humisilvae]|uniref:Uncharacterized protein n=1 Tax=Scleromatobacter humisilvae TaxID=2897159 RepID=A0A9X1YEM7_9BURK|nr:hypothetical protein [Scleromatobacter humisilvae]MCK9685104.1 hypothetical protein [Scleromatobacter humisilvae]
MSPIRTSLLLAASLLAVAAAGATTVKTGKPAASQPAAPTWATRAQLRECADTEAGLKERFRAIDASNTAHEKRFDQLEAENTRLEQLHDQLDHDSDIAVKAFNVLVKEHNEHIRQLNQDAADSRPVNDAYNADMSAFNHKCSGLRYHLEDMEAVTRERQKAAAQAAAASTGL